MNKGQNKSLTGDNNAKRKVNDVQLACAIIEYFHLLEPHTRKTANEVFEHLDKEIETDLEKVTEILKKMGRVVSECFHKKHDVLYKTTYAFSIKYSNDGIPHHYDIA